MATRTDDPASTSRIVVVTTASRPAAWMNGLDDDSWTVLVDVRADEEELDEALASATAVVIDGSVEAPLAVARRVRRFAPHMQVVLVVPPPKKPDLQRTMLFTPGLGEPWIVEPQEVDRELLKRASRLGEKRRNHAQRHGRISERVEGLEPGTGRRAFLPDQYLATLLELLPDPVLALDEAGDVLFANPVAESVFGLVGRGTEGSDDPITLLAPDDSALLEDLLERGRQDVVRQQTTLRTVEGTRRTYDVAVAPVGGERPVRALLLHDVTDQVEARQTLERQAERLEKQAEERERLLEERDRAMEEMEEAMRQRSQFFANMSHELRTPLNAIVGYNDLLLSGIYGEIPDKRRKILDQIRRASEHLMGLIEDILDLSKVEAEKLNLEPEEVSVQEFVADLSATMEPQAQSHEVDLGMRVNDAVRSFRTDPRRLRQILMNLISNAIHYGAGEPVDVRCRLDGDRLVVEVEDRGPGIPPDRVDDIFDEFFQIEGGEGSGTGLGLSIARTLARALGGELTVASEPGEGSVFTLRVPELPVDEG